MAKDKNDTLLNLNKIPLPDDKAPSEYDRNERCAYIYEQIKRVGHPDLVNKKQLERDLEVSHQTIYNDLNNFVYPYLEASVGKNHAQISDNVYQRCVRELLQEGDWKGAAKVAEQWNDWLSDRGFAEKEPDKHEVNSRQEISTDQEELINQMFSGDQ